MVVTGDLEARRKFEEFRKEEREGQLEDGRDLFKKMFNPTVWLTQVALENILIERLRDCEHLGKRERRLRKEAISETERADHAVPDGPVPQALLQAGPGGRGILQGEWVAPCTGAPSRRTIDGRDTRCWFRVRPQQPGGQC